MPSLPKVQSGVPQTADVATLVALPGDAWLNIGGSAKKDGWKVLNIQPGAHVDHAGDVRDLTRFADQSWDAVYASHTLEHLGYQKQLPAVLNEINRILRPGGKLFVSVPDLDTLCRLFVHEDASAKDRFHLMRMMFGGQLDEHDFHFVGLNQEILAEYLFGAGFQDIFRVPEFNIFDDTSSLAFAGVLISLNLVASK
jgi:predicted SAM-dependent methyltransferase